MENLYNLTGYESGIVIYPDGAYALNWVGLNGLPRSFATGLIGLGEDLGALSQNIGAGGLSLKDREIALQVAADEVAEQGGNPDIRIMDAWSIMDALIVVFKDWA